MSTWRGKALKLFPECRERILAMDDQLTLWREIQREFHGALNRADQRSVSRCLSYALWMLHPPERAKALVAVSASAAWLLHRHAIELHQWIERHDFMEAQSGLQIHLGNHLYPEFEARFLEKIANR